MTQPVGRTLYCAAALMLLGCAVPALAASQGSLGASSRGSIAISVSLRPPVRAEGLTDFALDGAAPVRDVCFRGAPRGYAIAVSGNGPGGALTLSNGDESIAYRVEWLARADRASAPLLDDTPPLARATECAGAPSLGRLSLAFEPADLERLQEGGAYTGSLVLMLAPE